MLSGSISDVQKMLQAEAEQGTDLSPSMQWRLVDIMTDWKRMAADLESLSKAQAFPHGAPVKLAVVGGTDFASASGEEQSNG